MLESPISRRDQLHRLHRRILMPLRIGIRTFHVQSSLSTTTVQRDSLHYTWSTNDTQATRHHRRFPNSTCQRSDIMWRTTLSARRYNHHRATSHLSLFHHLLSPQVFIHNMCPRPTTLKRKPSPPALPFPSQSAATSGTCTSPTTATNVHANVSVKTCMLHTSLRETCAHLHNSECGA
jgi:hypothetical protein